MGGGVIIALLLISAIDSRLPKLTKLLIENFKKELCEAFRFCDGLKLPKREYQGKIVWAEMTDSPCFIYDNKGMYINQTCYFIPRNDKYLCAVLNSRLIYFYMKQIASGLGNGALRWIKQFIENLPIPKITESNKPLCDEIIKCVDKILEIKACHTEALAEASKNTEYKKDFSPFSKAQNDKTDSTLDTSKLESQIDSLVYKLYNLTKDEIAIIDSKT